MYAPRHGVIIAPWTGSAGPVQLFDIVKSGQDREGRGGQRSCGDRSIEGRDQPQLLLAATGCNGMRNPADSTPKQRLMLAAMQQMAEVQRRQHVPRAMRHIGKPLHATNLRHISPAAHNDVRDIIQTIGDRRRDHP